MLDFFEFVFNRRYDILAQTLQHLYLTLVAILFAIVIGVSIGIALTRSRKLSNTALSILGVIQTIPSLALLGFMLPLLGIGAVPAIVALFLYALLPIVQNTFTGISEVEKSIIEAARGMGMTDRQILSKVELPLAVPVIFAGIRTATVINVGVATLCSLIGAGGLGEFIFSGISLVNTNLTLSGAIPAALLALLLDGVLALLQKNIQTALKPVALAVGLLAVFFIGYTVISPFFGSKAFTAGFDPEFRGRPDGYPALKESYGLYLNEIVEMDAGLMYEALREGEVDVISGYATEGKIKAYELRVLEDDQKALPPYFVAPLVHGPTLEAYPQLKEVFAKITGKIPDSTMRRLNFEVDKLKRSPQQVAHAFLKSQGFKTETVRRGKADIIIGGKKFTEQYILLEIFRLLIENYSGLDVGLKKGLGGTQILFDALRQGEIDIYPEYTGTALSVILKPEEALRDSLIKSEKKVYDYVKQESTRRYQVQWLEPLGFNNTYALMMREKQAEELGIKKISDLQEHLDER